ncbi:MAG TPA: LysR family transcriptional regulator [Gammaproteobacteria bacterium]|nr:LysR family transcriptional regulator [Gammaproteobacteria bacterium]
MNLDDLTIFRTVVHEGGITRAAAKLHRVQSNITTRVRQLEAELGVDLFVREGRRLTLAPAGRVLLNYTERLLALADEARLAVAGGSPQGSLRLGSMESTAAARLPRVLADYHARYLDVQLELRTGPSTPLVADVIDGRLDAALVSAPIDDPRLHCLPVFEEELLLITPATQPAVGDPRDLQVRTLLTFAPGCAYRRHLEAWLAQAGVVPERVVELSSYHAMFGCAAAGMGIALAPRSLVELMPVDGVSLHSLPPKLARVTTVLARRRDTQSPAADALAALLTGRDSETAVATGNIAAATQTF